MVLCFISFILLIIRLIYPNFIEPDDITIKNLPLIQSQLDSAVETKNISYRSGNSSLKLVAFDPNTVSENELIQMGFRERTAKTFMKFRNGGFIFRKKEDLKKVYGISERFYSILEPYIIISSNGIVDDKPNNVKAEIKNLKKLELNSADSLALIELKGVGPGFAKRIIKYRSMLGGFIAIEQLKEVYGMTDELYSGLLNQCSVNPELITKLNINTADFKTVNKHPYIGYELTKQIFSFRKNTKITGDNLTEAIPDEKALEKVRPYLSF